ncbi:unnamed protein product [Moneuplotes crassus]|uniref:Uncharacterized protein n=1 Tax=Euplotes crassus TaxID=5936 RepID=A0AAD2DA05_EUPCR|nr:unnamed protein product [Moneuplotes crassus]
MTKNEKNQQRGEIVQKFTKDDKQLESKLPRSFDNTVNDKDKICNNGPDEKPQDNLKQNEEDYVGYSIMLNNDNGGPAIPVYTPHNNHSRSSTALCMEKIHFAPLIRNEEVKHRKSFQDKDIPIFDIIAKQDKSNQNASPYQKSEDNLKKTLKSFMTQFAKMKTTKHTLDTQFTEEKKYIKYKTWKIPKNVRISDPKLEEVMSQDSISSLPVSTESVSQRESVKSPGEPLFSTPSKKILVKKKSRNTEKKESKPQSFYYFDPKVESKLLSKEDFMAAKVRILSLKKESKNRRARLELKRLQLEEKIKKEELEELQNKIEEERIKYDNRHKIEHIQNRIIKRKHEKEKYQEYLKIERLKKRTNSVKTPLYKKIEEDFEKNVILPEIHEKQQKLQEYKKFKNRQPSLASLKSHQEEHKKLLQKFQKELTQQRDYKKKYPSIKVPRPAFLHQEPIKSSPTMTPSLKTSKNVVMKIPKKKPKPVQEKQIKGFKIYKVDRVISMTELNKKIKKDKSKSEKQCKTLVLPPWNSNKDKQCTKPPKVPIKMPVLKLKKSRNVSDNLKKKTEDDFNKKKKIAINKNIDFLKEMREKRKNKKCNSEQRSLNSSYKAYYNWDHEIKKASNRENLKRVMIQAQELEDRAKKKEMIIYQNKKLHSSNPTEPLKVNDMLIHSIKAKMKILDQLNESK